MAKTFPGKQKKADKSQFPSPFGSHASMVDEGATNALSNNDLKAYKDRLPFIRWTDAKTPWKFWNKALKDLVALKDENGVYVTERNRLDNKMADPNRYSHRVLKIKKIKE